ncbi:hypothetical protein BC941DRAFT_82906 [Chlamydoabsidia padenii]|nr:hypothetical protein BC941DRAFT_82906 [Chlamydoabsidia padenii]
MTCPSRFIGKRIDLSLSFTNASFFKENTVDHWHLDDFITWKRHDNKGFNDCFPLLSEYEYALNNLKQVRQLDPVLISYVTELKINNKYTKKAFKTWWENRRSGTPSSNTTIINNNNSRNTNILSASNVTVNSTECVPPPPPQQQPQQGQAPPSPAPTQQQGHISKDISEPRMSVSQKKNIQPRYLYNSKDDY